MTEHPVSTIGRAFDVTPMTEHPVSTIGRAFDVTPMTIHTVIKRLYCFIGVLAPTYTTFKKINSVVVLDLQLTSEKIVYSYPNDRAVELLCCFLPQ